MNEFIVWISRILDSWKFWVTIPPWEIGVRIRFGKHARTLSPGFHFRIPFVDTITFVNTRLRIETTPPVTVAGSTKNCTRYISSTLGFRISDPLKAMSRFGAPSQIVISKAQGEIAASRDADVSLANLRKYFTGETGVEIEFVKFVEDVEVKTYRLINGGSWCTSGHENITPGQTNQRY
jgi:hypothetical protein